MPRLLPGEKHCFCEAVAHECSNGGVFQRAVSQSSGGAPPRSSLKAGFQRRLSAGQIRHLFLARCLGRSLYVVMLAFGNEAENGRDLRCRVAADMIARRKMRADRPRGWGLCPEFREAPPRRIGPLGKMRGVGELAARRSLRDSGGGAFPRAQYAWTHQGEAGTIGESTTTGRCCKTMDRIVISAIISRMLGGCIQSRSSVNHEDGQSIFLGTVVEALARKVDGGSRWNNWHG